MAEEYAASTWELLGRKTVSWKSDPGGDEDENITIPREGKGIEARRNLRKASIGAGGNAGRVSAESPTFWTFSTWRQAYCCLGLLLQSPQSPPWHRVPANLQRLRLT